MSFLLEKNRINGKSPAKFVQKDLKMPEAISSSVTQKL